MRKAALVLGLFLLSVLILLRAVAADDDRVLEYRAKAAFIPKIAHFVDWPACAFATNTSPVVIGILGPDPFGVDLQTLLKKQLLNGRQFQLKHLRQLQEAKTCQLLYVSRSERGRLPQILEVLKGKPVLTVGDHAQFAENGGMVNFIKENGQVRFEVNVDAAAAAGLSFSAKFLQVAKIVSKPRK